MSTVPQVTIAGGPDVRAGQSMLVLDSRGDVVNADKASAQVAKDQALLDDARRTLARNEDRTARDPIEAAFNVPERDVPQLLVRRRDGGVEAVARRMR